jgi:hypothetical protein
LLSDDDDDDEGEGRGSNMNMCTNSFLPHASFHGS